MLCPGPIIISALYQCFQYTKVFQCDMSMFIYYTNSLTNKCAIQKWASFTGSTTGSACLRRQEIDLQPDLGENWIWGRIVEACHRMFTQTILPWPIALLYNKTTRVFAGKFLSLNFYCSHCVACFLSAFLQNCFLCWDCWNGDVMPAYTWHGPAM